MLSMLSFCCSSSQSSFCLQLLEFQLHKKDKVFENKIRTPFTMIYSIE